MIHISLWEATAIVAIFAALLSGAAHIGLRHWNLGRPATYWGGSAAILGSLWLLGLLFGEMEWPLVATAITLAALCTVSFQYMQERTRDLPDTHPKIRRLEEALAALADARILIDEIKLRLVRADDLERIDPAVRDPIYEAACDLSTAIGEARSELEFVRNGRIIYPV